MEVQEEVQSSNISDYLNLEAEILTTEPIINVHEIDWIEKVRKSASELLWIQMNPYRTIGTMIYSDEEEDIESESVGIVESLDMLDKIRKCTAVDEESQAMLYSVIKKLEGLRLKKRIKLSSVDYFKKLFSPFFGHPNLGWYCICFQACQFVRLMKFCT